MLFWSGKTYNVFWYSWKKIFENITFCLCSTFFWQFCHRKVFSIVRKTTEISYILARSLRHHTMWYCHHKVIPGRGNIFDISWQNLKYPIWYCQANLFSRPKTMDLFDILEIQIIFRSISFCLCHRYQED